MSVGSDSFLRMTQPHPSLCFRLGRHIWSYSSCAGLDPWAVDPDGLEIIPGPGEPFVHLFAPGALFEVLEIDAEHGSVEVRGPAPYDDGMHLDLRSGVLIEDAVPEAEYTTIDRPKALSLFPGDFPGDDRPTPHEDEADGDIQLIEIPTIVRPPELGHAVQLSGPNGFESDGFARFAAEFGLGADGYLEIDGVVDYDSVDDLRPYVVHVYVGEHRIGCLNRAHAAEYRSGEHHTIPLQVFTAISRTGLRGEVWTWLGDGEPAWPHSEADRPLLTREEREAAAAAYHVAPPPPRTIPVPGTAEAKRIEAGTVEGWYYMDLIEPITQLKRGGRLEEALELCRIGVRGAEGAARAYPESATPYERTPNPWFTEQLAIVLRKLGRHDEEEQALERWIASAGDDAPDQRVRVRLEKLRARRRR